MSNVAAAESVISSAPKTQVRRMFGLRFGSSLIEKLLLLVLLLSRGRGHRETLEASSLRVDQCSVPWLASGASGLLITGFAAREAAPLRGDRSSRF